MSAVTLNDPDIETCAVLLNGRAVSLPEQAWRPVSGGTQLEHSVSPTDGLRPGLNSLEVVLLDGSSSPKRHIVLFSFSASLPVGDSFELGSRTTINTAGDDHQTRDDEKVVLRWTGDEALSLSGWRLTDEHARHTFRFPDHELKPGEAFTLVTGTAQGRRRRGVFSWNSPRAVWNNRGDTIRLVDDHNIVRFEQRV